MGYHAIRLRAREIIGFLCLLVALAVGTVLLTGQEPLAEPVWSLFKKGIPGGTEAEQLTFLRAQGWEADETPLASAEVTIPAEFDEAYEQYNAIQQAQDFNLQKVAGETVTEVTYHITNYPEDDNVVAHLLIYKDKIIGADISSTEQGGFVEPLKQSAKNG